MKKVTIYTLAEELGMTPSMVSRALNPNGKVNEQKRALVLKTAEKYNFMPNKAASRLSGKFIKIGVVICSHFKPIRRDLIAGITASYEELRDYKIEYELFEQSKAYSPEEFERLAQKLRSCDGVIVSGYSHPAYIDSLRKLNNLVFLQSSSDEVDYLFASEHDMALASDIAAEFLTDCLKFSGRKNIALFTGTLESPLHVYAKQAFEKACKSHGLNIVSSFDMKDSEEELHKILCGDFDKNAVDGIYITSGVSLPLCRFAKENRLSAPVVTFDTYKELNNYIKDGTVTASIFQNAKNQAKTAFERLVRYLTDNTVPEKKILTSVQLVMKSNLKLYE